MMKAVFTVSLKTFAAQVSSVKVTLFFSFEEITIQTTK